MSANLQQHLFAANRRVKTEVLTIHDLVLNPCCYSLDILIHDRILYLTKIDWSTYSRNSLSRYQQVCFETTNERTFQRCPSESSYQAWKDSKQG